MMSVKMGYLLSLAAFLFLPSVPTVAKLVDSMSDCAEFLLEKTPPQVPGILEGGNIKDQNRYKPICQTFNNEKRFVTLYDTQNKIPVFSAYKYRGEQDKGRPKTPWKIEPQLENKADKNENMKDGDKEKTYNYQAGDIDYKPYEKLDRGHLFPSAHAFKEDDKKSTFTLTNIVPQEATFNQGSWRRMETCIKCVMDKHCINNNKVIEGFVVTGAQPNTADKTKNTVNIPSKMWSAFCCYNSDKKTWIASAHFSDNVKEEGGKKFLQAQTLEELHKTLKVSVFPEKCPNQKTATEFYPHMEKECECPPST
ncbi:endonuclease domain-containing 1 protein-like [Enoplosus armatus]|uniref:endonuclease domain-containing 1 protein-like n=1 Tax=Enoplosus armatus TaxID=215367 RepID=UPI003994A7D3